MKLSGTCVVKLSDFFENLKEIAGTRYSITRVTFDENPDKSCSFSHINKNFKVTWNICLEKAGLAPKRILPQPPTQGRKSKDKTKYREVSCLRCDSLFVSPDPSNFRICSTCKNMLQLEEWNE